MCIAFGCAQQKLCIISAGWMSVCVGESGLASSYYDYVKKFDEYNIYGL